MCVCLWHTAFAKEKGKKKRERERERACSDEHIILFNRVFFFGGEDHFPPPPRLGVHKDLRVFKVSSRAKNKTTLSLFLSYQM